MLGLAPNTAALRNVKVRGAERDVLRVRQQVERALSSVEWMPAGVPPGAILLVRRLTVGPKNVAPLALGERVSLAMRELAARARRPWWQDEATDAEAVLFADEAELAACLARDWLRDLVEHRWWWRLVLRDAAPESWVLREVVPHGALLAPALGLLATQGEAVAFVARLAPADCETAITAVAAAHSIPLAPRAAASEPVKPRAPDERATNVPVSLGSASQAPELHRLLGEVPEIRSHGVSKEQRRLLALALVVTRAASWSRTPRLAVALEALAHEGVSVFAQSGARPARPHGIETRAQARPDAAISAADPNAAPLMLALSPPSTVARRRQPPWAGQPFVTPAGDDVAVPATPRTSDASVPSSIPPRNGAAALLVGKAAPTWAATTDPPVPEIATEPGLIASLAEWPQPRPPPVVAVSSMPRLPTAYGGIFYLLNAALALSIYGDFTAPRTSNLELSPWDWLALVGREWFGEDFVEDPAWTLLAELAGRTPFEMPDRDFEPPHDGWLREHLAMLRARLVEAVDPGEGVDVAAFVCRHPADLKVSATTVHVFLSLAGLDLAIRIAGLDRDTGWIPAAGRAVQFHFH